MQRTYMQVKGGFDGALVMFFPVPRQPPAHRSQPLLGVLATYFHRKTYMWVTQMCVAGENSAPLYKMEVYRSLVYKMYEGQDIYASNQV